VTADKQVVAEISWAVDTLEATLLAKWRADNAVTVARNALARVLDNAYNALPTKPEGTAP
jgi:uncharacterized HAD superfamily protein